MSKYENEPPACYSVGDSYPQPPQACRLRYDDETELDDGSIVTDTTNLEWRGEITVRYDPDKPDMIRLHTGESSVWIESWMVEFIVRQDGPHTVSEAIAAGIDIRDHLRKHP